MIADDANLDTARELGFATVRRNNVLLGRKFNDGIQLACDPKFNPRPVDYVVPCGSDDWVDPRILLKLPVSGMLAFRRCGFVREDGARIAPLRVPYEGGLGIRVIPASLVAKAGYRPAVEDAVRGIDHSIFWGLYRATGRRPLIRYGDVHQWQIVDWKTKGEQLNRYRSCLGFLAGREEGRPFRVLRDVYPAWLLDEMRDVYAARGRELVAA